MEEQEKDILTITEEKEQKVSSIDSAIKRLQTLSQEVSVEKEEELKEEPKTNENYYPQPNDLEPEILKEEILSEEEDAKKNKKIAWLAYILFFIPLMINKKSQFVRLHANEGLDVFIIDIFATILVVCGKFIPFTKSLAIVGHLLFLVGLGLFALTTITKIFQIIRVALGKKNQTPWLWKTRFIK